MRMLKMNSNVVKHLNYKIFLFFFSLALFFLKVKTHSLKWTSRWSWSIKMLDLPKDAVKRGSGAPSVFLSSIPRGRRFTFSISGVLVI